MVKLLKYGGKIYKNFIINDYGIITNLKTRKKMKPYVNKAGYVVVSLAMGSRGKVKIIRIHKALAETFIPNPNNLPVVNHIDENKTNYSLDNLEWVSYKDNTKKHWEIASKDNWFVNNRKLSKKDILFIRKNKNKISNTNLAKKFNVSETTIRNTLNNISYSDIS